MRKLISEIKTKHNLKSQNLNWANYLFNPLTKEIEFFNRSKKNPSNYNKNSDIYYITSNTIFIKNEYKKKIGKMILRECKLNKREISFENNLNIILKKNFKKNAFYFQNQFQEKARNINYSFSTKKQLKNSIEFFSKSNEKKIKKINNNWINNLILSKGEIKIFNQNKKK
ncbi:MAG: hypothetical protein ACTSRP_06150 [Candidatus Helarchaeota archaeon]